MSEIDTSYGSVEIPSETPPEAPAVEAPVEQAEPEAPWWQKYENEELELQAAGKTVKAPFAKVKQWAQQGYDYGQRMQQFNQQKAEFEARQKEFASDADWQEIVKYAKENKDWAEYTRQQWENRDQWRAENADNPLFHELNALKKQFEPIKSEIEQFREYRDTIKRQEEDSALDKEIKAVSERYAKKGMDLAAIDPSTGLTYEHAILKHQSENGIPSFRTALLDLYGDRLESLTEESIKKQLQEEQAKLKREGFIGRTPTPTQSPKPQTSRPSKKASWSSVIEDAIAERSKY